MMNCERFEELVHDLGRPGRAEAAVREQALAHAASCARCGELWQEVQWLDQALRSVAAEQSTERADNRVEMTLMAEFRAAKNTAGRQKGIWRVAAVAAAAVILWAGGWVARRSTARLGETNETTGVNGPANPGSEGGAIAAAEDSQLVMAEDKQFIRLPYAGDGSVLEDDAIVRTELPRASLVSMGFPVDASVTETVPVEVMVSEYGTPEAIRLVAQDSE
jgi:hypothetical protein